MQLWHPRQTWYHGSPLPQDGCEALLPGLPFDTMNFLDPLLGVKSFLFSCQVFGKLRWNGAKIRGQKSMEINFECFAFSFVFDFIDYCFLSIEKFRRQEFSEKMEFQKPDFNTSPGLITGRGYYMFLYITCICICIRICICI